MWSSRRQFLRTVAAGTSLACLAPARSVFGNPPQVRHPRATDGDERHEPAWDERLTVTVGPSAKADLQGANDKVIQAAVDYVARLGGGTVQLLPGTFLLRNAVHLASHIRLRGSGNETIVTKIPSTTVPLVADSDWYDQEITLKDGKSFRVGDGVTLQATNPHNGTHEVIKRTLIARSGNRFKINDGLRKNLWTSHAPTCSSLFPLLTSEYSSDVLIEDLVLDGNGSNNENLNGNYAGCIFLQDCNRYTIRNVEARNYNGDGISFQICHDVRVENCHSHDNVGLGLHPGSGSQRPILVNNRLDRNQIGLFWCWGVKFGLAEHNTITGNRNYGISIGHNDTDNLMRHNVVSDSGKVGILFRDDSRGIDFWANRNRVEHCRVVNSGDKGGVAIDIQGRTSDVALCHNQIEERRASAERIGIRIASEAGSMTLEENSFSGLAHDLVDQRRA